MQDTSAAISLLSAALPPLLYWYGREARALPWRKDPTPYHIWISEIMLQQTRVEAVKPYYERFLAACPTPAALAEIDDERLMKLWEGLGYYSRARNLKKAAKMIVRDYGGSLPRDHAALLALPGVGPYTAGAIASIAFGMPTPAIDGNVLRVMTRLLAWRDDIAKPQIKAELSALLSRVYPTDPEGASATTQAIMELGALICLPNGAPRCDVCPLSGLCRAKAEGLTGEIPFKSPKKPRTIEKLTVLILHHGDTFALCKRPDKGLLASLWALPHLEGHLSEEELKERFGTAAPLRRLPDAVHIFTHREWQMIGYEITLSDPIAPYTFKTADEIKTDIAIASAFRPYLRHMFS